MSETKPNIPAPDAELSESLCRLEETSRTLKEKIDEERRRHDMPLELLEARQPGMGRKGKRWPLRPCRGRGRVALPVTLRPLRRCAAANAEAAPQGGLSS